MKYLGDIETLRKCRDEALAYGRASRDFRMHAALGLALEIAESTLSKSDLRKCLSCNRVHSRKSEYCSYSCAEEDGAIEK